MHFSCNTSTNYRKNQVIPILARAVLLTIAYHFLKKFHIVETCVVYQAYFPLRKGTVYYSKITGISRTFSSC